MSEYFCSKSHQRQEIGICVPDNRLRLTAEAHLPARFGSVSANCRKKIETNMDNQPASSANAIELRIEELSQLFHSLDPFPFRERDLDKDAEEFIVGWARELPADQQLRIVIHLPESQASTSEAHEIAVALNRYFSHRARVIALDLNELFRIGWRSLVIGLTVLSLCVIAGQMAAATLTPRPLGRVIEESLTIFGWVANWRPIEIFLYEWWPIVRRRYVCWV